MSGSEPRQPVKVPATSTAVAFPLSVWISLRPIVKSAFAALSLLFAWHTLVELPYSLVKLLVGLLALVVLVSLLASWVFGADTTTIGAFKLANSSDPALAAQSFSDRLAFHLEEVSQRTPLSSDTYWGGFPLVASLPISSPPVYQRLGSISVAGVQFPTGDVLLAMQQLVPFHRPVSVLSGTITQVAVDNPHVAAPPATGTAAAATTEAPTASALRIDAYIENDGQPRYSWTVQCALPSCTPGSPDEVDALSTQLAYRVIYDQTPQHDRPESSQDLFELLLEGLQQLHIYLTTGSQDAFTAASQKFTNVLRKDPTSPYAAYALGRLFEHQAYYSVRSGEVVLKAVDPLGPASATNPAVDISPANSEAVLARNGINVFQNLACSASPFAGVTRNSDVSGGTACLFPTRDQAFGYLGLAMTAADRYLLASCATDAAKALLEESLADVETAQTDAGRVPGNGDVTGMMNSGVPTMEAMRALVLEEQIRMSKSFGYNREEKRKAALDQWQRLGHIRGLDPADQKEIHGHIDALQPGGSPRGLGGPQACTATGTN